MRRILREPLVHFLVLGAVLFAAFQLTDRGEATEGKIVITSGKIEHLVTGFSRTWRRPPTAKEQAQANEFLRRHRLVDWCRVLLNLNEFVYVD